MYRFFVLILLAAAILFSGGHSAKYAPQASAYFWKDGKIIRVKNNAEEQGVLLNSKLSCADTPPEVSRFFGLSLPINQADQYALMALPGIGPKLAENILNYRAGKGSITGPDDFMNVKGIGPKRLSRLTPLLCFDHTK